MSKMYYTKEHEWVKVDGNIATVGISDYAAHQLGDITFVELPKPGKAVKQFEVLCAIESVKAASDIYAPVSGTVVSVNEDAEHPARDRQRVSRGSGLDGHHEDDRSFRGGKTDEQGTIRRVSEGALR